MGPLRVRRDSVPGHNDNAGSYVSAGSYVTYVSAASQFSSADSRPSEFSSET